MKDDNLQQSQSSKSNTESDSAPADDASLSQENENQPYKPEPPASQTVTVSTDDATPSQPETGSSSDNTDHTPTVQSAVSSRPKKKIKGLYVAALVLVVVVALAGIGYVVDNLSKPTTQSTVVVKKDIADLKVDIVQEGMSHVYYPNLQDEGTQVVINMQMFEGLTKFEDGTTIEPDLALSWTNPNSSTWIFKLRPNVKFHTGRTMTASDVKASIEAVEPTSWGQEFASTIKSIEVVNPLTVEIDTNGPDPLMLNELTKLYIYDTTSGKQNNPINGTGPYTLASDTTNDVELTAFNDYWGGHIYTRRVDFLNYYPASTIPTNLMKTKQLQLVVVPNDPTFVSTLKGYGYQILDQSAYAVGQIVFDTLKPGSPLASTAVRRALAEAVNKPELISVSDNTGSPPINQIVPQGIPGYDPSIPAPVYSVTKAKADLAAAGYPNGFSFNFAYVPTSSTTGLIDELQKELGDIGVTVVPDPTTSEDTFANIVEQGGADSYYDVLSSDYVDGSDIMSFFIDSPYFSNPALDVLNTQASKTLDQTKRVQILEQMNAMIASDQADIPLFQRDNLVQATAPSVVIENDTVATALLGTYFYHDYQK